jgi:hypothetical protein
MFPIKNWDKVSFKKEKRSSAENGIIGELIFKENRRELDSVRFKNNHEFNLAISIAKKYGFNPENLNDNEIEFLKRKREEDKENNWLDKKEGDMEW